MQDDATNSLPARHTWQSLTQAAQFAAHLNGGQHAPLHDDDHALLRSVVGALALPVLLLDDVLAVRYINPAARRRLLHAGLQPEGGHWSRLPTALKTTLLRRLAHAPHFDWGCMMVDSNDGGLPVGLVPLQGSTALQGLALMLVLGTQGRRAGLALDLFCNGHGITEGERHVLDALCDGLSPNQIADQRGVTITTVRSQLAAIRGKTGTPNLRSLLQRVADLPALQGRDLQSAG